MVNDTEQQIFESINKANRILVALPQNINGDALGAGLALFNFLKKLDKQPEVVCSNSDFGPYKFLPHLGEIKKELDSFQSFVVSLKTATAQLDELSYEVKKDRVDIYLKPKNGKFSADDLSFRNAKFPYDLIITVDTPSLEHLGEIYEKNTDLFFETPVVNIDHHPANENYGQINLVDLTATSTSEILTILIENFEENLIDEDIATALLTGIIVETNSFQHVKTTPKAFLKASALVSRGAKQQDIIRELYKTKNVSLLKLWGRALARIRAVPELGLTYSLVNHNDFVKSGSTDQDVLGVMKELVANLAGQKIILFLAEAAPEQVVGYFSLHPSLKAQVIAAAFGGQMLNGSLGGIRAPGAGLLQVEQDILGKLQKIKDQIVV